MKVKNIRSERNHNKLIDSTEIMAANVLGAVDMQSYTDMVRAGINPWLYTFRVMNGVLRAYIDEIIIYEYDPEMRTWAKPSVKDGTQGVQLESDCPHKEDTK